ncbi:MAG: tRNA threonylcarbamoyladenosine dehydratase [Bacilli bacterium]|nr:tRNA threonylcarbamoyladenosine dehydratase [Bacilli bacterium]
MEETSRIESLIGTDIEKLKNAKILIFGVGGVGSYVVEMLARSFVGHLTIVDSDIVQKSNINRQLIAYQSTIGLDKVFVEKQRILDIFPNCEVITHKMFVLPENLSFFEFSKYDYIIDAIDTVSAKIAIIEKAQKENVKIISSMGTGNKFHPELLKIMDISKTSVCPLARVMRYELRKRNINHLTVLSSTEAPVKTASNVPGSMAYVPSAAGILIASHVINEILGK